MATLFLDLDGTLTDPKPGITRAFHHALSTLGLPAPAPEALGWVIGPALVDSFARMGVADTQAALALYREAYTGGAMYECTVIPGIPEALGALLGAGHVLHLATAKPHDYARKLTAHFGLARFLTHEFGPELDGTRNDKGALLAHALAQTGEVAARSVMIGDRYHDIDAARAVGMRAVAVTWGYGAPEEHAAADAVCTRPADLPALVNRL